MEQVTEDRAAQERSQDRYRRALHWGVGIGIAAFLTLGYLGMRGSDPTTAPTGNTGSVPTFVAPAPSTPTYQAPVPGGTPSDPYNGAAACASGIVSC